MNNYLFLFTLGPVQSFIRQARKTRDLYAGSQLLSKLIKKAMDSFMSEFDNGWIIFPYYQVKESDMEISYPNRFVATVNQSENELKRRGINIENAVRDSWHKIAKNALIKNCITLNDYWKEQYFKQIDDLLQIYWLFIPTNDEYSNSYQALERLNGAIKNLRKFNQFPERGIKCSLDGVYNAIFFSSGNNTTSQGVKISDPYFIAQNEGLSAVSFVKRAQQVGFPSTSTIALMQDIAQLDDEELMVLECFKKLFSKNDNIHACLEIFSKKIIDKVEIEKLENRDNWNYDFDSHFLFEENLVEKYFSNAGQLKLLKELQLKLSKKLKTRYYAVVLFDGDQMGKWLSGGFFNENEKIDLKKFHQALSKLLSEYAKWARQFLSEEKKNGHTIYAGGDDFLGFVNVHCLFEVLKELRVNFDKIVNEELVRQKFISNNRITFSAGIVIAHYKMPFSEVLNKVRVMEKKAKSEGNRNSFGIAVIKHSGEIHETVYKWDSDQHSSIGISNLEALKYIYEQIFSEEEEGTFSNTFIQVLTNELQLLHGWQLEKSSITKSINLTEAEVVRLLKRSCLKPFTNGMNENIKEMKDYIVQLYESVPSDIAFGPKYFVHALQIADFLKRKTTVPV